MSPLITIIVQVLAIMAAQDSPSGAKTFLRQLYSHDSVGRGGASELDFASLFEPQALERIAGPSGEMIGSDPICDCQDFGDIVVESIEVRSAGDRLAEARISFRDRTMKEGSKAVRYRLRWSDAKWRIQDIARVDQEVARTSPALPVSGRRR